MNDASFNIHQCNSKKNRSEEWFFCLILVQYVYTVYTRGKWPPHRRWNWFCTLWPEINEHTYNERLKYYRTPRER